MDLYKEYKEDKKIDKSPGSMYNSFRSKVYTHEEMIILGKTIKQIKEKRNEYK